MGSLGTFALFASGVAAIGTANSVLADAPNDEEEESTIVNWSNTHECKPAAFHQPDSLEELERLVAAAHRDGRNLRPIGSALSPNGAAFSSAELVSVAMMDRVVKVDPSNGQVTVQAGARVSQVTEAIKPYGLVLQNFASIAEQQVGGFMQVGAHGTGARLPPVDEQVVGMTIVTPGMGTLRLSEDADPELFRMAKVAMGSLGVVAEATLQCVPAHQLVEKTFVASRAFVAANHAQLLRDHKHIRFMWIPYTDAVVVVGSNPLEPGQDPKKLEKSVKQMSEYKKVAPLRDLLLKSAPEMNTWARRGEVAAMNFAQLRDALLALAPLDTEFVKRVNAAEAQFWRNNEGVRVDWSHRVLGFECGGEQWVSEVAFPAGTLSEPSKADMGFMADVLELIEKEGLPAPAPIEQRWTSSSTATMSIASSPNQPDAMHSWVGIIMYLPTSDPAQRSEITARFNHYKQLCMDRIWEKYGAVEHWAKVEVPATSGGVTQLQERLQKRFPVDEFNRARARLDPKNILSNELVDTLFPRPPQGPFEWILAQVQALQGK